MADAIGGTEFNLMDLAWMPSHVSNQWLYDLRAALDEAFQSQPAGIYLVGETFAYDDIPLLASYIDPERR